MLESMNRLLRQEGIKELYFRDYLQSCVWIDEKRRGIRACMSAFNSRIRPLVLDGIDGERIPQKDRRLYRLVVSGRFPQFYKLMRVFEKITGWKWGIRR